MNTKQNVNEPLPASDLFGLDCGPSYCAVCGEWPASMTPKGKRCHMCWTRDIAAENPVPLPNGKQCLEDLASIGVPGAAEKLAECWPNVQAVATEGAARRSNEAAQPSSQK